MEHPAIDVKHGKLYKKLKSVALALEHAGIAGAVIAGLGDDTPDNVLAAVKDKCSDVFGGMPSDGTWLQKAAFVLRAAQVTAGFALRSDEQDKGAVRAVLRLVDVVPTMSADGEYYTAAAEVLTGRMAGKRLNLGKVSAKWLRHFIRQTGGRAFVKYKSAADAGGLFFTAWIRKAPTPLRMLENLSASNTQKAWNRKLLDARQGECVASLPSPGGRRPPCMPCPACEKECRLGRWQSKLRIGNCPVCRATAPMLPCGVCLQCVYKGSYRSKSRGGSDGNA